MLVSRVEVGLPHFFPHHGLVVVKQNGATWIGLAHLVIEGFHPAASRVEARDDRGVQAGGLAPSPALRHVAHVHVRLTLVHATDGQIDVHVADVGRLHGRVVELRQIVVRRRFVTPHDGEGLPDLREGHALAAPQDTRPIITVGHDRRSPNEAKLPSTFTFLRMAEQGAEGVFHVACRRLNRGHVTAEFVVDPSVPIRQEDHHVGLCIEQFAQPKGEHLPADVGRA